MPNIYLYRAKNGLCCMTDDGTIANDLAVHSGFTVYVLDVEEHVPTPPKKTWWVVVDEDGDALVHGSFTNASPDHHPAWVVSYDRESDAILLKDVLTRGGMTDLTVRKIEE